MARRLRVQYPGAIDHLMARGNGRQDIVRDDADRDRLVNDLGRAAERCSWRIYAFVVMSNDLHYVHLNPVRARLVENPAAWKWSSYPGYVRVGRRLKWVAYDELLASAWACEFGGSGSEPARAYRRYVTAGLSLKHESP
jgi:REP element-mobilizing transposase RayT